MLSEKTPFIGDIVHYTEYCPNPNAAPRVWPAIIVQTHSNSRVDLQVFTVFGMEARALIPYSDGYASDSWSWPPEEEVH